MRKKTENTPLLLFMRIVYSVVVGELYVCKVEFELEPNNVNSPNSVWITQWVLAVVFRYLQMKHKIKC